MVPESTRSLSGDGFSFEEFDIDFEFDAPRFYDFTRPELDSETEHIELWFQYAGNYPPSPFSPKFNWKFEPFEEITKYTCSGSKPVEISKPVLEDSSDTGLNHRVNGFIYYNNTVKDVSTTKAKCKNKPSNSTLTRPTASLLARQNKPLDVYSVQLLTRCQRSLSKFGDNLSPILVSKLQNQDNKRQKMVAKVAQVNPIRRPKLTVPKEPNLRTAERSQRHRSKVNSETEMNAILRTNSSKRTTTNKNINLEFSSTSMAKTKSNSPRSQDLQAFRLRTSLRAEERSSNAKINRIQDTDATKSRTIKPTDSSKSRIVKGNHRRSQYESESCPLDSKRSSTDEAISIKYGNQSSCRTDMKPFLDINRSLDLCRNFDTQEVAGNLIIA